MVGGSFEVDHRIEIEEPRIGVGHRMTGVAAASLEGHHTVAVVDLAMFRKVAEFEHHMLSVGHAIVP